MKISIITVAFNSEATITDTIDSVLSQTYKSIEYIIIDGNSTDQTVTIVNSYGDKIDIFISEPDDGLYDAMNKGIALATGDVVGILNSDDFYATNEIIECVVDVFKNTAIEGIYANLEYVDSVNTDRVVRFWQSKPYKKGLFCKGWHPAHPTFFVRKEVYKKYGFFNLSFTIAADYEIMLRFIEKYQISCQYIDKVFVRMRVGGKSNRNLSSILKANYECYQAWEANKLKPNIFYLLLKPTSKILQFMRRKN